jgi:hypothetical protein
MFTGVDGKKEKEVKSEGKKRRLEKHYLLARNWNKCRIVSE